MRGFVNQYSFLKNSYRVKERVMIKVSFLRYGLWIMVMVKKHGLGLRLEYGFKV